MDKHIITRELQILLEAINEQFEIIREYEDFIPQIEFDMIMENVRKLYETFHRLQRLNDPLLFVEKKISGFQDLKPPHFTNTETKVQPAVHSVDAARESLSAELRVKSEPAESPEPEGFPELRVKSEPAESPEPEGSPKPEGFPELRVKSEPAENPEPEGFPEPEGSPVKPLIPARPVVNKDTRQKNQPKTAELELFAQEEPVFNIRLKEAREKSLGPKMSRHDSFKASIGINDKFLFINELFDGNLREYNECIETLGGFKTLPQAQEYLDLLRRRNNWNSTSPAFRRIKELVEKGF